MVMEPYLARPRHFKAELVSRDMSRDVKRKIAII